MTGADHGEPTSSPREAARRRLPPLLVLSAALVATALAAGLRSGWGWLVELLVLVALAQGLVAGLALPLFWREGVRPATASSRRRRAAAAPEDDAPHRILRVLLGAGGRYLGYLASVAFAAVEAHAVGAGLAAGAPPTALTLLVPPVILGALVLRGGLARLPGRREGSGGRPRTARNEGSERGGTA